LTKKEEAFTLQSFHGSESTFGFGKLHKTKNHSLVTTLQQGWWFKQQLNIHSKSSKMKWCILTFYAKHVLLANLLLEEWQNRCGSNITLPKNKQ